MFIRQIFQECVPFEFWSRAGVIIAIIKFKINTFCSALFGIEYWYLQRKNRFYVIIMWFYVIIMWFYIIFQIRKWGLHRIWSPNTLFRSERNFTMVWSMWTKWSLHFSHEALFSLRYFERILMNEPSYRKLLRYLGIWKHLAQSWAIRPYTGCIKKVDPFKLATRIVLLDNSNPAGLKII
jgi:hypothetical protein